MPSPERHASSPLVASAVIAVPGIAALLVGAPVLFASLGPTAVMQAQAPADPASRLYAVVVSHLGGMLTAFGTVALLGLAGAPSVFATSDVSALRVMAAIASLAGATAVELLLNARHPPAASTTLLVALGSFHPTWYDTVLIVTGVTLVGIAGEAIRRARLRSA